MTKPEIERKFLIRIPAFLDRLTGVRIAQTYLLSETGTSRVRLWEQDGVKKYIFTHKERVDALTALETEREITEEEYQTLLSQRDPQRNTVYKTRYLYPCNGLLFEIDVYPFWQSQCVMEVELENAAQSVEFPPDITVLQEVTADVRYKNARLARCVPEELK